ncbi:hypothetical protein O6H91_01G056700 [Diphasiastrum complanatum]|uniref:Uncharacterized protein n=1 Tax=Diphasiastrum complanatum TaxID=34168 RepID=A0ACC2ERE7_DIPCM|nr:hypothetical protein O6H91_Y375100 [Diphasiastrum complanatum]KAJ7569001.1 hypothetical protein O6H91_01G056700 [Diphasiastrum complanatum]
MARTSSSGPSSLPVILIFGIVMVLATGKLYMRQDPRVVVATQTIRGFSSLVVLLPLFIVAAMMLLTSSQSNPPSQRPHSFSEFGGSTWRIALLIGITLVLIRFQSTIQESWHPLLRGFSRRKPSRNQYYRSSQRRRSYWTGVRYL